MRLVVVKWIDAECQESRWNDLEETLEELNEKIQPCITAGFLLKDTPQFLAVTLTDGIDCCGPFVQIPRCCIIETHEWEFSWGSHEQKKQGDGSVAGDKAG